MVVLPNKQMSIKIYHNFPGLIIDILDIQKTSRNSKKAQDSRFFRIYCAGVTSDILYFTLSLFKILNSDSWEV